MEKHEDIQYSMLFATNLHSKVALKSRNIIDYLHSLTVTILQ